MRGRAKELSEIIQSANKELEQIRVGSVIVSWICEDCGQFIRESFTNHYNTEK